MYRRIRTPATSDRNLAAMDRARAAASAPMAFGRENPQVEMVPPQPVLCEAKRSFWNPKQINEMKSGEIRNKIKRLDKANDIISKSGLAVTMAEMLGVIGNRIYQLIEYGPGKGTIVDEIDIGIGITFCATMLATVISRLCIVEESDECHRELLKRAEQK